MTGLQEQKGHWRPCFIREGREFCLLFVGKQGSRKDGLTFRDYAEVGESKMPERGKSYLS